MVERSGEEVMDGTIGGGGGGTLYTTLMSFTFPCPLSLTSHHITLLTRRYQDNFALSNPYEFSEDMYEAIQDVEDNHIVTHESDHEWRNAVVTNQPSLLALRLVINYYFNIVAVFVIVLGLI